MGHPGGRLLFGNDPEAVVNPEPVVNSGGGMTARRPDGPDWTLMTDLSRIDDSRGTAPSSGGWASGLPRWLPAALGVLAVLAILGLIAVTSGSDDGPDSLDDFTFRTTDGGEFTLAELEGTPLVVNYFASWCAPCRAELPDFETVHQETKGEVVFVGISRDSVTDSWFSLVAESGVTFTTVYEGNVQGSFAFLGATAMPTTVFVGADGTVERVWSGALTDDKLRELIAEHLV